MEKQTKGLTQIREILQSTPPGMTIIDIATTAGISRNTAAKHLNVLLASGQVEMQIVGPAKLYFLSNRVPFSSLLNSASDSIIVLDESLEVRQANDRFFELFGIEPRDVIGKSAKNLPLSIFSESGMLAQYMEAVKGTQHSSETRFTIQDKDYYLKIKLIPTAFDNGARAVTAILEDVTVRKKAEKEIQRQHDFLEKAMESLTHPFYVINVDDYIVRIANKAANFGSLTGNQTCYALTHKRLEPCDGISHPCPLIEVKRTKQPIIVEHLHFDNKDKLRILEVHGYPILDNEGNVVQMIEYNLDITDNKRALEAIKNSEIKFRSIFENAPVGIARVDTNGLIMEANGSLAQLLDISQQELVGMNVKELSHPDDYALEKRLDQEIVDGLRESYTIEKRFIRKDDSTVWGRLSVSITRDEKGDVDYIIGMVEDISKSRWSDDMQRIQHDLMSSLSKHVSLEEASREILQAALIVEGVDCGGLYLVNDSTGVLELVDHMGLSDEFVADAGLLAADSSQVSLIMRGDVIYGNHSKDFRDTSSVRVKEGLRGIAIVPIKHDNKVIAVMNLASHIHDEIPEHSRQFIETLALQVGEVWVRIKAERELSSSETRFRSVFENAGIGMTIVDVDDRILDTNQRYQELIGYTNEELKKMSVVQFTHPDDVEADAVLFGRVMNCEIDSYQMEKRYIRKNGKQIWVNLTVTCVRSTSGDVEYVVGMAKDTTERKLTEEELRETQERFQVLFKHAPFGAALVNMEGHPIMSNLALHEMLGYTEDEFSNMKFTDFTHPDDVDTDLNFFEELVAGERDFYQMEKRYIHKDGQLIWGSLGVSLVRDSEKRPKYVIGMVENITDRKNAEDSLKDREEKYRHLFDTNRDGVVFTAIDGTFMEANPTFLEMTGYTMDELRLIDYHQITPKDWNAVETKIHETQVMTRGHSDEYEKEYIRKDGTVFPAKIRTWLAKDKENNPRHVIALVRDITESKRALASLQGNEELYRRTLESISDVIFVVDQDLRIVLVNPAFKLWCEEISVDSNVVNKTIPEAFPFLTMSVLNEYTQVFDSGESRTAIINHVIADKKYSMETTRIPILTGGKVTQILTVMRQL
ncbi:MAG: PAS domain S-box protein [Candidatus Thorarchaeota archaeon]|jgi:PAS domain S-box-containing protein